MLTNNARQKLIIVVGPTSSGKSELAVKIAKSIKTEGGLISGAIDVSSGGAIGGAIISADSRQVYRGMDIGTGKVTGSFILTNHYTYKGVRHYGIDIANPKRQYSVTQFQKYARKAIRAITQQGLVPIICGGTAHWIDAVVYEQTFPTVKPNAKLRKELEQLSTDELFATLQKLDPERAIDIDAQNPRRLVRALEIVIDSGKPVPKLRQSSPYNALWLGISVKPELLEQKIHRRLKQRLKQGMLKEVISLHQQGLSWTRLEDFGLEYKYCALQLQGKLDSNEMFTQLFRAHLQYVKRQLTWWKRNKDIHWSDDTRALMRLAKTLVK